jgi:hypothetical protein
LALYNSVKDDPRTMALPILDVQEKANKAFRHVTRLQEECTSWKMEDYKEMRDSAERHMQLYKAAFADLLEYNSTLHFIKGKLAMDTDKGKRRSRTSRLKLVSRMVDGMVPENMAKHIAAIIEERGEKRFEPSPVQCGIRSCSLIDTHDMSKPALLVSADDSKHWGNVMKAAYGEQHDAICAGLKEATKTLKSKGKQHAVKQLGPLGQDINLDTNVAASSNRSDADKFEHSAKIAPSMKAQLAWSFSIDAQCHPLPGIGKFISVHAGFAAIVVLDVTRMVDKEFTLDGLKDYIVSLDSALCKEPTYLLGPGEHCYIPLGFYPVVISIGASDDQDEYAVVAYVCNHILSSSQVLHLNGQTRAELKASIDRSIAKKGKFFEKGMADKLSSWIETWSSIAEPAVAEDVS